MSFTFLFYKHIMFRKSCGKCHFCNTTRPSDITLADFWGWEKTDPKFNEDNKGVNLVLINTLKGHEIFEAVKDKLDIIPTDLEKCMQPNLQCPSVFNSKYTRFESDYQKKGFEYVYFKYGELGRNAKMKNFIKCIFCKVKNIIR